MKRGIEYDKVKCERCGTMHSGVNANLDAEQCRDGHEQIIISVWDFELPGLINFFTSYDSQLLPKGFVRKLRNLRGRVLRGIT